MHKGKMIARVYRYPHGAQKGSWGWFLQWGCIGNSGTADSMEDALEVVRVRHEKRD